jgi:hypothetical protein
VDIAATLEKKLGAMREYENTHSGEMHPFPHPRSYEALEAYARRHGAASGLMAAEPFMLVRQIHSREGRTDGLDL